MRDSVNRRDHCGNEGVARGITRTDVLETSAGAQGVARLKLDHLTVDFTNLSVLADITLEVQPEEFLCIVGPSGCGKSTLLNAMAGFVSRDVAQIEGSIAVDGKEIRSLSDWGVKLGFVFQRDALWPWRTVLQNVEAGLEIQGVSRQKRRQRAKQLIDMVGLTGFENFYPHKLSGGMRQRASLIRTLAYDPQIILMDEPFGALDAHTRMILQREVTEIWQRTRKTILLVTHDLAEAIVMAQRVVILSHRPATIVGLYDVPFAYPRDPVEVQGKTEFADLYAKIWRTLGQEFRAEEEQKRLS